MSDSYNSRNSGFVAGGSFNNEQAIIITYRLGVSFGRVGSSYGPPPEQYYYNNVNYIVPQDQFRSSVGLEEPMQNEYPEPEQKGLLYRSSGDQFEMQFEELRIDRMNLNVMKIEEDVNESKNSNKMKSFGEESNSYEQDVKLESGDIINNKFKPEVKINQALINDNKNLFNVNQSKSIYTNKITQLVDQVQTKVSVSPKSRQSKSQQKLQRKSSNNLRDNSESGDFNQGSSQISGQEQDPVQQKLAKNRESARNSRARKKIYYELLETKVNELQDEVDRLREQCKNYSKSIDIQNKSQEKFSLFLEQQQQLFDKLETLLVKGKDNQEVGIILDALRYRTNSNSQERNDAARGYFDSIVEVCLPIQTKYLLYALERGKDFFATSPDDYTDWMREPFKKTEIKPEQINKVKKMKLKLQGVKNNISENIARIKEQIKLIQSEAAKVDQMWEQLKECLTPIQLGTCILAMRQVQKDSIFQRILLEMNSRLRHFLLTQRIHKWQNLFQINMQQSEEDQEFNFTVEEQLPMYNRKQVKKSQ
ncbi:hypothetical protein pb186bvf_006022 [Paramecium bursaria]